MMSFFFSLYVSLTLLALIWGRDFRGAAVPVCIYSIADDDDDYYLFVMLRLAGSENCLREA